MLEMLHPTSRENEGKNLGRKHLELSERRRAFARKKQRAERAEKKAARMKHKAARARSRLEELTFGTFSVYIAAVNAIKGKTGTDIVPHVALPTAAWRLC